MRKTCDSHFVEEGGEIIGIALGADFCAEHEIGIKGIRERFGIDRSKLGFDGRAITKNEDSISWVRSIFEGKRVEGFTTNFAGWDHKRLGAKDIFSIAEYYVYDRPNRHGSLIGGSWDENHFSAFSHVSNEAKGLKEIFEAVRNLNACIFLAGGRMAFGNPGLHILIKSKIPQNVSDACYESDLEGKKLAEDFDKTGIRDRLGKAGKKYFALSPKRSSDGSIIVWLNPVDQDQNNYGWMTIQDLEDWIAGKGKVPKTK